MSRSPGIWAAGLAGSGLFHAGAAALLLLALRPDPVPEQPSPQSSLSLQAHRIPRSEAVPQAAEGDAAAEAAAKGQGLSPGTVPHSRAGAAELMPARLQQAPAAATPATSPPPQVSGLTAATASAQALSAVSAPVQSASAASLQPAPAVTAAAAVEPAPQAPAASAPLPQITPAAQPAPAAVPDVPTVKAALAFQGGGGGAVDPVSLAAFQSFMQPGDAAAGQADLRDGLAGLLAAVPCSRLQVMFDPETATLSLRGHLPEDGLRAPVLAALQAEMGRDITVSDEMRLLPRPQCGALSGIADAGLPQSTDQITNPLLVGADAHARVLDYRGGEQLFFDLTAPDYQAYIYVDYFDAGGAVLHLTPNASVPLAESPAKSRLRVGAKDASEPGLQITVGPPYGQEIAVAFAASHPLYDGLRPIAEPAAPYLAWLQGKIAEARAQHADFKGEWVYFLITTQAP